MRLTCHNGITWRPIRWAGMAISMNSASWKPLQRMGLPGFLGEAFEVRTFLSAQAAIRHGGRRMTRGTVESAALRGCCRVYDALDKRNLLNTLYTTLANEAEHEKSLRLEWIVIILIAIEIVMGFSEKLLPWLHGR